MRRGLQPARGAGFQPALNAPLDGHRVEQRCTHKEIFFVFFTCAKRSGSAKSHQLNGRRCSRLEPGSDEKLGYCLFCTVVGNVWRKQPGLTSSSCPAHN